MIEFKTTLDLNTQKTLNKFMMKKFVLIFLIFPIILIAIGTVGIIAAEDSSDIASGISLIVIALLLPLIMLGVNKAAQSSISKQMPYLAEGVKEIYRFYDDRIEHLQKCGDAFFAQKRADYSYVFKAVSTPTHYFVYISANQCHVIPKDHITQGSCEELDKILAGKLPLGKFKKKSK